MTRPRPGPTLAELFTAFLKLGAVSFGGPAIVAYIRRMAVRQRGWLDEEIFARGNALCQAVPGAISVQMAAYAGMLLRGVRGALAACAGYVCVPFLTVLALSLLYRRVHHLPDVAAAMRNLHVVVIAILAHASWMSVRAYLRRPVHWCIAAGAGLLFAGGVGPAVVICLAGCAGYACRAPADPHSTAEPAQRYECRSALRPLLGLAAAVLVFFSLLYAYDQRLFLLSLLMCKIDLLAFGGGYTSVPLMLHEIVTVRGMLDTATLLDGIALGQITPGPVALTATFIGCLLHGVIGAAAATLSVFLPSFVIILVCMPVYDRMLGRPGLQRAADGILCSFVGLMVWSMLLMGGAVHWTAGGALCAAAFLCGLLAGIPLPWVVAAGLITAAVIR